MRSTSIDPAQVREFMQRRWDLVAGEKTRYQARRFLAGGPAACLRAWIDLRWRFLQVHPEGSSERAREEDLAHHRALANTLRSVADGFLRA